MDNQKQILIELRNIKQELDYIKEHMVDADAFLTPDEKILLDESMINEKQDKLISLEELEHARNNA